MIKTVLLALAIMVVGASFAQAHPRIEEISVQSGDAVLAGSLTLPEGNPRALVVLIQGAGPHGRDQVISGAPMFAELADGLARMGVASVRIDNAGVGRSTGAQVEHFKQREPHIRAVVDAVRTRPELSRIPFGLAGHSEGTMVANRVFGEREEGIDFLILLGAPGRPGRVVWVDQQSNPERFPDHTSDQHRRIRQSFDDVALASIAADRNMLAAAADRLFAVVGMDRAAIDEARPGFVARTGSAEMQVFLGHDPAPDFSRVDVPVLAVWGGRDRLTDPHLNVPAYLANSHADSRLTLTVLPDEDHFFLRGIGLAPGEHVVGKMRLSDRLLSVIDSWFTIELAQDRAPDAQPGETSSIGVSADEL